MTRIYGKRFTIVLIVFATQFIGIAVIGSILGQPDSGNAITNQPTSLAGFVLDIVLMTWLVTALGEEFFFRGIIINRLRPIFNWVPSSLKDYLISGVHAIWFGMAHPSQGVSGMLIAGLVGFVLGIYFLKNASLGLWPLVLAHALIDTIVLTIAFI